MTNPKAGHTSATGMSTSSEGLRDGDGLSSPSLTNIYEGIHGNGILRMEDTAVGATLRNSVIASTPGFIEVGASGALTIHGGFCVLDGVLYKFAGGPGATQSIAVGDSGTANFNGELPAVPTATSDVFVVVYISSHATPSNRIRYEIGTPVAPSAGTPLIPSGFLSDPSINDTRLNHQTIVLGVLRYTLDHTAGNLVDALNDSPVLHDRRVYVRNSPMYLQHVTKGGTTTGTSFHTAANAVRLHTDLAALYSGESGDLTNSRIGAIWQSHSPGTFGSDATKTDSVLYYACSRTLGASGGSSPVMDTHRLGPDALVVKTLSGDITFKFDDPNIYIITTDAARKINPTGTFPAGHTVEIYHKAGAHTLHFDSTSGGHSTNTKINQDIANGEYGKFVYDGDDWHKLNLNTVSS